MDGGQIVRSIANLSKNRHKANQIASYISLIFSILLVIVTIFNGWIFISILGAYYAYLSAKELYLI